jgi:flavin reductase (DIM6/NTAB) family NADH-FMN oxidoreductase RutF
MFTVNMLRASAEALARRFASPDIVDKFKDVPHHFAPSGAPILDDALAWLDCGVRQVLPGGDHTIFIGEIRDGDGREGAPLLHYRGAYARLPG